mmetsp:Transcript_53029/g.112655  ORF Transcript_53029/g.112655 Transcript_53029/m.112655 type:complete len:177 (-) Transcript_53029:484-1014(-)
MDQCIECMRCKEHERDEDDSDEDDDFGGFDFVVCEHCSQVGCRVNGDHDMWECVQCKTASCVSCRQRIGLVDNVVSSCDDDDPLTDFTDHLYCGSCRHESCCDVDEPQCLACKGYAFDTMLQVANGRKEQIQKLTNDKMVLSQVANEREEQIDRLMTENKELMEVLTQTEKKSKIC